MYKIEGVPLGAAASQSSAFEHISGTLVGSWTPEYAKTLNSTGYSTFPRVISGAAATCSNAEDGSFASRANGKWFSALPNLKRKTSLKSMCVRIHQPIWKKPKPTTENSSRDGRIDCNAYDAFRACRSSYAGRAHRAGAVISAMPGS
jgi:hypothetical protein